MKRSGKTYVYINDKVEEYTKQKEEPKDEAFNSFQDVVRVKDEQILLLKKSIKWMKKQYGSEISRLEQNQKRIIGVFNREIELLQSAFNEMRSVYRPKLNQQKQEETEDFQEQEVKNDNDFEAEENTQEKQEIKIEEQISLKNFTIYLKNHNKSEKEIKLIILKAIQNRDDRFIYNKKEKKLSILNEDFSDLI